MWRLGDVAEWIVFYPDYSGPIISNRALISNRIWIKNLFISHRYFLSHSFLDTERGLYPCLGRPRFRTLSIQPITIVSIPPDLCSIITLHIPHLFLSPAVFPLKPLSNLYL